MFRTIAGAGTRMVASVILFGLALGVALGVTFSVMPTFANHDGEGAVHVCVNNSTGAMRGVSKPHHCTGSEHLVNLGEAGAASPLSGHKKGGFSN